MSRPERSIDPNTGVFTWTPTEAQGPNSYTFDVIVTDDGTPILNDSETITVTVNEANVTPVLNPIGPQPGNEGSSTTFTASRGRSGYPLHLDVRSG